MRGLGDKNKRVQYFHWLKISNIDITLLQETFITNANLLKITNDWNGKSFHCVSDSPHSKGVSILIKKGLNIHIKKSVTSNDGRIIMLIFEFLEETYSICNIYAPIQSTVKDIFFHRAAEFLNVNIPLNSKIIMCGDMNIKLDNQPGISQSNKKEIILLNTLTAKYNLKDIFSARDKHSPGYTYQHSNNNILSRIDYIFMDPALMKEVSNFRIKNSPAPDHKALLVTLTKSLNRRGPSYWKLNTSVLVEPEYIQTMTKLLDTELAKCMQNRYTLGKYCQFWDLLKIKIKEHSILYCKKRNIYKKNRILYLEEQIDKIDEQIASKKYHDNILNLKKMELKSEFEIELRLQAKASQIRSKAQYVEEGEKNTAYFLSLEKQRQISNTIYKIQTSDGILVKSNENIMSHIKMFYTDLYSTRHTEYVDYSFIDSLDTPRLKDGDQDICEGLITLMECDLASQKMKLDKSPGLDGIPIEFYLTFWHILGSFLIKIYNESFQLEKLCNSQRISVLSLLHKKGDVNLLKNYRPISLTNVDYRILGQVLANRLHKVLPTLISPDQAGYVKGRYIGNNIRAIEDLILYAEKENVNSIICFLDFQKAFDSVEWECIYRVLKKFNIGNDYIKWIKTLYYKPKITTKNNGLLTDYIELQRSVRQGCSVSALLFILVMEILAIKIKSDNSITGIRIDRLIPTSSENEIKILQYADDLILTLANEESLRKCLKIVSEFSVIAGPVLNINKSEIIGTCQYKTLSEISNIKTTNNANCLGIYVGHDKTVCDQKNWYDKIEKLQSTLATWSKRNLTLFGSVAIIKAVRNIQSCILCPKYLNTERCSRIN